MFVFMGRETYVQVDRRNRTHGTGKNCLGHRLIMQKYLRRGLHSNEIVHHKDGDPKNNEISNLEVVHRRVHPSIHAQERLAKYGEKCLVKQCTCITMAWHGLCHGHGTVQGMWAKNRGHSTGWNIKAWLKVYRPRKKEAVK